MDSLLPSIFVWIIYFMSALRLDAGVWGRVEGGKWVGVGGCG